MRMEELFSGMLNGFRNAGTLWESWIVFQEQMNCLRETKMDSGMKVSRLIKRRSVANEACDSGRVTINGRQAKASAEVKKGEFSGTTPHSACPSEPCQP